MEVTSLIELTDSDIIRLEQVFQYLSKKQGTMLNLDAFQRETIGRFEEAGFKVEVKPWETNQRGMVWFDIEIVERLRGEFDPDQMVWEVTKDILDIGEKGVIKSSGIISPKSSH